jgi:putative redox protein
MSQTQAANPANPESIVVEETRAGRFQVAVHARGVTFIADEPAAFGGLGSGPNPYDLLSAALGACTAMTLRLYADRKSWPLRRTRVRVEHVRATLDSRDRFEREITLEGDLDDAQRSRLLDIANHCPVHLTLERGADVHTVMTPALGGDADPGLAEHGQHVRDMNEACLEEAAKPG